MKRQNVKTEEQIIDDLHEGVRELGNSTTDTSTRLGEKAISAIRRIEQAIPTVKEHVSGWKTQVNNHVRDTGKQLEEYIQEKPWTVVGAAVGVGLLIGLLFSGHDDRES